MFKHRQIFPTLLKEIDTKEIIVLTGMRQVGKTTLLKGLMNSVDSENKIFLDLGNPLERKLFEEKDYNQVVSNLLLSGLKSEKNAYVFLDEIQNMPEIPQVVKYLYDHYQIKFFLTGSSSYYLKNLFSESLAGRKLIYEIFPLTFAEFLVFKDFPFKEVIEIEKTSTDNEKYQIMAKRKNAISHTRILPLYEEYINFGGFPGVVLEPDYARKESLLEGVFRSYFEIDIKNLSDFKDLSKLRELILLLPSRMGSKIDITKISSELGVSRETIYSYLSFLEQTYFISMLPRFSRSFDRASAGGKKLYFCDSGLANFLGKPSVGSLLENAVFQVLRASGEKLSYFDKKSYSEIDFIVNGEVALEVKEMASSSDVSRVERISEDLKLSGSYVVSNKYIDDPKVILACDLR